MVVLIVISCATSTLFGPKGVSASVCLPPYAVVIAWAEAARLPQAGVGLPMDLWQFDRVFPDDEACAAYWKACTGPKRLGYSTPVPVQLTGYTSEGFMCPKGGLPADWDRHHKM